MHEIGVVRSVIRTVEDFAKENNISEVTGIVLDVGELSLVVPKYIDEIYKITVQGSILEKAELTMNVIPGMAECEECDEIFNVIEHEGYCPKCGSFEKTILSGKDFTIKEIHVPEEE